MAQTIFIAAKGCPELTDMVSGFQKYGYEVVSADAGDEACNLLKTLKKPRRSF
jgi:hypothetical protein